MANRRGSPVWARIAAAPTGDSPGRNAFYLTLQGSDEAEVRTGWTALADGAQEVLIPLGPAPFSSLYGMLTDRFGVTWIIGMMS